MGKINKSYALCTVAPPDPNAEFPEPPDNRAHWATDPIRKKTQTLCGLDADVPISTDVPYQVCIDCTKRLDKINRKRQPVTVKR